MQHFFFLHFMQAYLNIINNNSDRYFKMHVIQQEQSDPPGLAMLQCTQAFFKYEPSERKESFSGELEIFFPCVEMIEELSLVRDKMRLRQEYKGKETEEVFEGEEEQNACCRIYCAFRLPDCY